MTRKQHRQNWILDIESSDDVATCPLHKFCIFLLSSMATSALLKFSLNRCESIQLDDQA
ncbi:hypothetical protein RchiOBHm_Chr2g0124551 [Rosa chinensis]|uniref:Uncharacterized protein n=1 Tax=Rosa chinensis TaxID=74649 RepID=A0A2P6RTD6_ROSCH|nr:hypothetical protein RchiOBHm_Chr2g0124551 [Rosa chinensis]